MSYNIEPFKLLDKLKNEKNILIIQDLDGVCIPLVKDPLDRTLDMSYVYAAKKLQGEFFVLTNGEHEGRRGVNRLTEKVLQETKIRAEDGLYLPGLAAGGVQYQDEFGNVSNNGVSKAEIQFLGSLPRKMTNSLSEKLKLIFPKKNQEEINDIVFSSIIENELSPTINLNRIFGFIEGDVPLQREVQSIALSMMKGFLYDSDNENKDNSFFLHIAPNLGTESNGEVIKYAEEGDVGTTDIQFMVSGALKEAGLIVLINNFIKANYGLAPLGEGFNSRQSPKTHQKLIEICLENINHEYMPTIIGVGDTVTSNKSQSNDKFLRGGSDRGFLTLIQDIGIEFNKSNQILIVDSSDGEVDRPSLKNGSFEGITDMNDPLKFTATFPGGPPQYIEWFKTLAKVRDRGDNYNNNN